MAIAFSCDCGKKFSVKDELAGKRAKCPNCSNVIDIPQKSANAQPSAAPPTANPVNSTNAQPSDDDLFDGLGDSWSAPNYPEAGQGSPSVTQASSNPYQPSKSYSTAQAGGGFQVQGSSQNAPATGIISGIISILYGLMTLVFLGLGVLGIIAILFLTTQMKGAPNGGPMIALGVAVVMFLVNLAITSTAFASAIGLFTKKAYGWKCGIACSAITILIGVIYIGLFLFSSLVARNQQDFTATIIVMVIYGLIYFVYPAITLGLLCNKATMSAYSIGKK